MQCAACHAVSSEAHEFCPRCRSPLSPATPQEARAESATTTTPPASHRKTKARAAKTSAPRAGEPAVTSANDVSAAANGGANGGSTLIEFPSAGRAANRPQWRRELSERVREIQQRRAREAALEAEQALLHQQLEQASSTIDDTLSDVEHDEDSPMLGLVTQREGAPPLNPLVVAALRRIERARQMPAPRRSRASSGGAATAVARAFEETYAPPVAEPIAPPPVTGMATGTVELQTIAAPVTESVPVNETATASETTSRPANLSVVQATRIVREDTVRDQSATALAQPVVEEAQARPEMLPAIQPEVVQPEAARPATIQRDAIRHDTVQRDPAQSVPVQSEVVRPEAAYVADSIMTSRPAPRRVSAGVIDDSWLERIESEMHTAITSAHQEDDDRAPVNSRLLAGALDMLAIFFIATPFAAIIELTNGNWFDARVAGSMLVIVATIMFLYETVSLGLASRTWGMWLLSLSVVDADNALSPTTGQSVRRAAGYVLSLTVFGLGLVYALLDAEGRTAHDRLSGTIVIRD
ncbi:MAG: RDD family protein [Pyrinomonadaceae bacterium]|nr:RDD family protein [Pyrinomonadaceae bacterium]